MPDAPHRFHPGDIVRVKDNIHPDRMQGIGIVAHEGDDTFGHGMIPVRWICPPCLPPLNYPEHRLELVERSGRIICYATE